MKKDSQKKQILSDHKKVGTRFVPPIAQLGITDCSYTLDILPNVIWMGFLIDEFGNRDGIEICSAIATMANKFVKDKDYKNFSLSGSYLSLSQNQTTKLSTLTNKIKEIEVIRETLAPLTTLYPDFPMSFIGKPKRTFDDRHLIGELKKTIDKYFEKYSHCSEILQTNVVYIQGVAGKMFISSEIKTPNLEAVISNRDSEEGQHAASFVRASVNMFVMQNEEEVRNWAKIFWNRNLALDDCESFDEHR
ncbi:MAG: hypothetical protein RJS98_04355 [Rhodospirillaceae bacterium]